MIDSFHTYPLFPDLLENQKQSVHFFWEKGILDELELFSFLSRSPDRSQNAGIQMIQRDTFLADEKEFRIKSFRSKNPTPLNLTSLAFQADRLRKFDGMGSDQKNKELVVFTNKRESYSSRIGSTFFKKSWFRCS